MTDQKQRAALLFLTSKNANEAEASSKQLQGSRNSPGTEQTPGHTADPSSWRWVGAAAERRALVSVQKGMGMLQSGTLRLLRCLVPKQRAQGDVGFPAGLFQQNYRAEL